MASQQPSLSLLVRQYMEIGEQISRFESPQKQRILAALAQMKTALEERSDNTSMRPDGPDAALDSPSTTMCTDPRSDLEPSYSLRDNADLQSKSGAEGLNEIKEILDQQFRTLDEVLTSEFNDIENKHQKLGEDLGRRLDSIDRRFDEIKGMLKAATNGPKGLNYQPSRMNTTRTIGRRK